MARFLERDIDPKEVLFYIKWRGAPGTAEIRRWFATGGSSMARALGILYANRKVICMGRGNGGVCWLIATGKRGHPSIKVAREVALAYRTKNAKKIRPVIAYRGMV